VFLFERSHYFVSSVRKITFIVIHSVTDAESKARSMCYSIKNKFSIRASKQPEAYAPEEVMLDGMGI
jgi:hypothetical protein